MKEEMITLSKKEYEKLVREAKKPRPPALLYEATQKHESLEHLEAFTANQVIVLFDVLENSDKYPKGLRGSFNKQRDITILATLAFTGMRPREACSLKWTDLNLQEMTIMIRGENNKTKKSRIVPIPKQLVRYFENFLKFPRWLWRDAPYIFPSTEKQMAPLASATWKAIMREKILKPAGLYLPPEEGKTIPKFRSYSLRHTFAQGMLAKSGMDINAVANLLGHAKLDSTKRYLHRNKDYTEYLRELMEKT